MFSAGPNYLVRWVGRDAANFGLLLFERAVRLAVGQAVVTAFLARYLGPADFGVFSFGLATVALCGAIAGLGLDEVVIRELVRRPGTEHTELLGSAALLKGMGAVVGMALSLATVIFLRPSHPLVWLVVGLLACGLLASPWDVLDWRFQAKSTMGPPVAARLGAFLSTAALKLGLIFCGASLPLLAAATALEPILVAAAMVWVARREGVSLRLGGASWPWARTLLAEGGPLLLSGLLVLVTMQLDKIIVVKIVGNQAGGYYSAATRISELFYAAPIAFGMAMIPPLARQREIDRTLYWQQARRLLGLAALAGILAAGLVSWRAQDLVRLLFGERFSAAAPLLSIHIWSICGIFIVSLRGRLLVLEKLGVWLPVLAGAAAALSVGLNLLLVPRWGALGAAWAAVAAWGFSALIAPWFFTPLRRVAREFFLSPARP
ncbi:MAG TPA: oligosaccharide flippase family protein [Lacunisphaera sp.]|nr:oligosaccharide flippase family protein [Lacunisphaera sp.]